MTTAMAMLCSVALLVVNNRAGNESLYIRIDPTVYDPALGGTNCDGHCWNIGAFIPFNNESYGKYAACPFPEVPRWSTLTISGSWHGLADGDYYCVDDGGDITILSDGTVRVDLLLDYPVWREPLIAKLKLPLGYSCQRKYEHWSVMER